MESLVLHVYETGMKATSECMFVVLGYNILGLYNPVHVVEHRKVHLYGKLEWKLKKTIIYAIEKEGSLEWNARCRTYHHIETHFIDTKIIRILSLALISF